MQTHGNVKPGALTKRTAPRAQPGSQREETGSFAQVLFFNPFDDPRSQSRAPPPLPLYV